MRSDEQTRAPDSSRVAVAWQADPELAETVRAGLLAAPKRLPPWLLYDAEGSRLFEAITRLPEYYLTRTERAILTDHADAIVEAAGPPDVLIELGAGSATKTALLLRAALARASGSVTFVPVDVSPAALAMAVDHLRDVLPDVLVRPMRGRYPEAVPRVAELGGRGAMLLLGSNLGNEGPRERLALLAALRRRMRAGDALVVGIDRPKDPRVLIPAYDDAAGVTAAFTLNVLARINRELGGRFDLAAFRHVALWNASAGRVELYLESARDQVVAVDALDVSIAWSAGERLHVEDSYKLDDAQIAAMFADAGFAPWARWSDPQGWFSVEVARAK
jgi:dimethylhistidine N-methyltransferase